MKKSERFGIRKKPYPNLTCYLGKANEKKQPTNIKGTSSETTCDHWRSSACSWT